MVLKLARIIPMILLVGLLTATSAQAAKKHFLDGLTGSWRGKGFLVTSPGAKEEAIRCRLRNRLDKSNPKLNLTGTCAIGGVVIPMNGWIKQNSGSKKYSASLFKSLGFLRIDSFTGSQSGKKLNLRFKGKDKVNKEDIAAFVTINVRGGTRFDIQLSITDAKTKRRHKVGTIKFAEK